MIITDISIENFRSYPKADFSFNPSVTIITGANGSGKTNILEAIYFLSTGKSFRSSSIRQLIKWDQNYSSVCGKIQSDSLKNLEVQLLSEPTSSSISRRFLVNQIKKTRASYLGSLKIVVFDPEDMRLVNGSPSRRRDFLDSVFITSDWRYAQALSQYHKTLEHRNRLLDQIANGLASKSELFFWDQSLIKNAEIINSNRSKFIRFANQFFEQHPRQDIQSLRLQYHPSLVTQPLLDSNYRHELSSGYTLSGPHRDDFTIDNLSFSAADKNLAFWGSRGQQRLAVLGIRLAHINYLENIYQDTPVLLLDDILSELDFDHQSLVVEICQKYQTIFTTADHNIEPIFNQFDYTQIKLNYPTAQT
ncbi:MAG TPA: DNA replication/repair protein RecF [Candidatus Woesebacteria bacterium]|nr:DNA replication/repair protein RecF [Candidatus Woesebacteria bacterium]